MTEKIERILSEKDVKNLFKKHDINFDLFTLSNRLEISLKERFIEEKIKSWSKATLRHVLYDFLYDNYDFKDDYELLDFIVRENFEEILIEVARRKEFDPKYNNPESLLSEETPTMKCWYDPPNLGSQVGQWVFFCPSCSKTHIHGAASDDGTVAGKKGHRISHCIKEDADGVRSFPNGYYLEYVLEDKK